MPGLQVVFVTVDPARDTPHAVGTYVHAFDPDFIGLTGDKQAIVKMPAAFGVAPSRVDLPGGDYTMDHSAVVFLLNSTAQIAGIFTPPFDTTSPRARSAGRCTSPRDRTVPCAPPSLRDRLFVAMQHLLPQHFLSRLVIG